MKTKFWILIIVGILSLVGVGIYLFGGDLLSIIGGETCVFERGSTLSGIYNCNSEDGCYAWIKSRLCSKKTEEGQIIFRTNANSASDYDDSGYWIAINGVPSGKDLIETNDLKGYCRDSSFGNCGGNLVRYTVDNNAIYVYNSNLYINTESHCRKYSSCNNADLTSTPKEPYTSNNQEILSSTSKSLYYCKDSYTINGNIKYLEYEGDNAGYYGLDESDAVKLDYGEGIELGFSGTIEYKEKICTK